MTYTLHYYGDTIRRLFIAGGIVMLALMPFFYDLIPYSVFASVMAVVGIGLLAGIIAPRKTWSIVLNMTSAAVGLLIFEREAVQAYMDGHMWFSLTNQVLAVIFFSAFYYSVKSARGTIIRHKGSPTDEFAMGVLKNRYAKGEVTTEEFEAMAKELRER